MKVYKNIFLCGIYWRFSIFWHEKIFFWCKNREKKYRELCLQDNKKYFYLFTKIFRCPDVSAGVGASTLTVTRKPSTRKARDKL